MSRGASADSILYGQFAPSRERIALASRKVSLNIRTVDEQRYFDLDVEDISEQLSFLPDRRLQLMSDCGWKGSPYTAGNEVDRWVYDHYRPRDKRVAKLFTAIRDDDVYVISEIDAAAAEVWLADFSSQRRPGGR